MNTLDAASLQVDFDNIKSDLPCTFTYLGSEYSGLRSDIARNRTTTDPGDIIDFDFQLFVKPADIDMDLKRPITIDDQRYKIVRKVPDPAGAVTRYDLATMNK